jgi:GTP-binding protein EngB required for normal cell division
LKDGDSKVAPVLFVTGKENVGKSALTSAIVRRLQARHGQGHGTSTRTYIAYYIFPKSSDKADEKLEGATTALR